MRKANREIKDFNEIVSVMERCEVCRLAFNNEDVPYILPLNFGLKVSGSKIELFFHSALEGTKVDLIKKDNRVSFEMDTNGEIFCHEKGGYCTYIYESVIGKGHIEILSEEEKMPALQEIMRHYHRESFKFSTVEVPRTLVYKLVVEELTGKARKKPNEI